MPQTSLAILSFAELRDQLKARLKRIDSPDCVDLDEALSYLLALPDSRHTAESVDALIQLAQNFHFAAQTVNALRAVCRAAPLAVALNEKVLIYGARATQGAELAELGRFAEATIAHAEAWSVARDMVDKEKEIWSIGHFGLLCLAMGQLNAASRYFGRARQLANERGFTDLEWIARTNEAVCAVLLREPAAGLHVLSKPWSGSQQSRLIVSTSASVHNTLARLYLLVDDLSAARIHAEESARLASIAAMEKTIQLSNAVLGLIDVRSGAVESGLSAVERALTLGRRTARTQLPEFLDICIDAYEAAGHSDKALEYLQELVEMKKKAIDSEIVPLQYDSIADPIVFQPGFSFFDERLLAKAHSLRTAVQDRIQWVIETAINAEMASGHDLYRTFRVATLSRDLAAAIGWSDERIAQLKLGARLCNIGMMAIPPRILLKATKPSNGERRLLRDHTIYGAQLLRKSKLRTFDVASAIAEQHHERYDGSGYPHGLSGESIAEEARLVAVCDAFDAMTHARPWRTTPLSNQAALNELRQEAASQFDPRFVDAFIDVFRRQFAGCDDLDAYLADGADDFEYVRARARMEGLISEEA